MTESPDDALLGSLAAQNRHTGWDRRLWVRAVLAATGLTAAAKTVLLALETFADFNDGTNAHPGEVQLALAADLKQRAVREALKRGQELGFIEKTDSSANKRRGIADVYRLVPQSITGTAMPVNNSTTGMAMPVKAADHRHGGAGDDAITGTAAPVKTVDNPVDNGGSPAPPRDFYRHGGAGHQLQYQQLHGVLRNPGTSPARPIADTHTNAPPSRFCDAHPAGTRQPCGDCANARTAFNAWQAAALADDVAIAAAHDLERRRQRRIIADCNDCDDFGRIDLGDQLAPCTHPALAPVARHA